MRIPLVRFGSDDRDIEPWEEWCAPVVLPVLIPLLIVALCVISAVGLCLCLAYVVVSRVLPRSWRIDWDTAFDLDPSVQATCPACQGPLSLGPVDKKHRVQCADQSREVVLPAQTATCLQCQQSFQRHSIGMMWSAWREPEV